MLSTDLHNFTPSPIQVRKTLFHTCILLALCSSLLMGVDIQHTFANARQQITTVRSAVLQGELPYQYTAHYYGVEVDQRDGLIALTLAYEPQNNPNLRGFVNFMVLDEDGMRRFQAGTDPRDLDLASGAPLQFDGIGNKMSATFRAVGRGRYTVIVFNNAQLPVRYTLIAEGAQLVDNANQSRDFSQEEAPSDAPVNAAPIIQPNPLGSAGGNQLHGVLDTTIGRHYLQVNPDIRDGNLIFYLRYDPLDQPQLHGNVNFWILDEAGLNAIIRGDKAGDVNLATGFPIPFQPFPNELQASFNASGRNPYTAVVYNKTKIPATYELTIDGGQLIDRYGQTVEAKQSRSEAMPTSDEAATGLTFVTARSGLIANETEATVVSTTEDNPLLYGVPQVAGRFTQAYQHHYYALAPSLRDGTITLKLTFDPKNNQPLRENINFLVLTEEGLRAVLAGGPPVNYDIATGSFGQFGNELDTLIATFRASGRGRYTVIVYNNSSVRARYLLNADGGVLATEDVERSLP